MANPYELDKEKHDKVYAKIAADNLSDVEPQEKPRAVITGGQPGSGKGGLTAQAKQEMAGQGGYVLVDPDELRPYHPHHVELMNKNDREAADFTHSDASKWAKHLTSDAIESRRNLIIDQTSKSPDSLVALTTRLQEAGYEVELRVIAVKAEISEQRIHSRYEKQKEEDGTGRYVPKEVHDAAYQGLPESVAAVERAKTVDVISVHDKHQNAVYENTLRDGEWAKPPGAKPALEAERERPLTLDDLKEKTDAYTTICERQEKRGAEPAEREAMEAERAKASEQLETARQGLSADSGVIAPSAGVGAASTAPQVSNNADKATVAVFRIDDMSTSAFEDLGRNTELGQVLSNAAERISNGEQAPFDLNDTNGNKVGRFEIVAATAPVATPVGGASLTVDLNQPAFAQDPNAQLAQYLNHAAANIYSSEAGTKTVMPAADGQAMGALHVSSAAPAPAVAPAAGNQHGISPPSLSM